MQPLIAAGPEAADLTAWSWEPWVLASLGLASLWYAAGLLRIARRARLDRVVRPSQIAAFAGGIAVLFLALVSPLDTMSDALFSAHMAQHLLLLLVAPPLLVWGRPALVGIWAFGPGTRKRIGRFWRRSGLAGGLRWLMHPVPVWALFSGSFVFWHMPGPYQWAVGDELVHAFEHLSFVTTALMFWTIVVEPSGRRRIGHGAAMVFLGTTAVFSGLPGAVIFLSPRPLYPIHAAGTAAWGLSLMEDQQLAGVIMWIPGGFVYLAAIEWLFLRWLREAERRSSLAVRRAALAPVMALGLLALSAGGAPGIAQEANGGSGGDPARGARLIGSYGCGACHVVPGIAGADGVVGPPLTLIGRRIYLAGMLRNTPDNMATWLEQPQRIVPGNAMPDMSVTPQDARDIAAYLDTLR